MGSAAVVEVSPYDLAHIVDAIVSPFLKKIGAKSGGDDARKLRTDRPNIRPGGFCPV
jgi:hypothetical protein